MGMATSKLPNKKCIAEKCSVKGQVPASPKYQVPRSIFSLYFQPPFFSTPNVVGCLCSACAFSTVLTHPMSSLIRAMLDRSVKEITGCGWNEVDKRMHASVAEDTSHPMIKKLHQNHSNCLLNTSY